MPTRGSSQKFLLFAAVVLLAGCPNESGSKKARAASAQSKARQMMIDVETRADQVAEKAGEAYDNLFKDAEKLKEQVAEQASDLKDVAGAAANDARRALDVRGAISEVAHGALAAAGQAVESANPFGGTAAEKSGRGRAQRDDKKSKPQATATPELIVSELSGDQRLPPVVP
jgi:hypothetical protein